MDHWDLGRGGAVTTPGIESFVKSWNTSHPTGRKEQGFKEQRESFLSPRNTAINRALLWPAHINQCFIWVCGTDWVSKQYNGITLSILFSSPLWCLSNFSIWDMHPSPWPKSRQTKKLDLQRYLWLAGYLWVCIYGYLWVCIYGYLWVSMA